MEEVERRLNALLEINKRILVHLDEINRVLAEKTRRSGG